MSSMILKVDKEVDAIYFVSGTLFIQRLGANFSMVAEYIGISDHAHYQYLTLTITASQVSWLKRTGLCIQYRPGFEYN